MRTIISVLMLIWFCNSGLACSVNLDCKAGSRCVRGVCIGGMSPGNANDRQPAVGQLDTSATIGAACSFDSNCGIGNRCVKGGHIRGVCMPRRR